MSAAMVWQLDICSRFSASVLKGKVKILVPALQYDTSTFRRGQLHASSGADGCLWLRPCRSIEKVLTNVLKYEDGEVVFVFDKQ
jgi:hypothetical protein